VTITLNTRVTILLKDAKEQIQMNGLISAQPTSCLRHYDTSTTAGCFEEPKKGGLGNFFDKSKTMVSKQSIQNRPDPTRKIVRPSNDIC